MKKIAIVGHSFVRRMPYPRLGRRTVVKKFGFGGAIARSFADSAIYESLLEFRPDIAYFQIGGNDINRYSDPDLIADDILEIVRPLLHSMATVFIGEIEPRMKPRNMREYEYNSQRWRINHRLEIETEINFVQFPSRMRRYLSNDGVHYTDIGYDIFTEVIEDAIMRY